MDRKQVFLPWFLWYYWAKSSNFLYLFCFIFLAVMPSLPYAGSVVVVSRPSCPVAWGVSVPRPGIEPMSPTLVSRFFTTGPLGKSLTYRWRGSSLVTGTFHAVLQKCWVPPVLQPAHLGTASENTARLCNPLSGTDEDQNAPVLCLGTPTNLVRPQSRHSHPGPRRLWWGYSQLSFRSDAWFPSQ